MADPRLRELHLICSDLLDGLEADLSASGADFPLRTVIVRNPRHGPECYVVVTNEANEVVDRLRDAIAGPQVTSGERSGARQPRPDAERAGPGGQPRNRGEANDG